MADHVFTEGEKKCLEAYWKECSKTPRKNLIKLVRHINMFNPMPSEKSWEYIFYDRQLTDEQVDFALKMKLRKPYYIAELRGHVRGGHGTDGGRTRPHRPARVLL